MKVLFFGDDEIGARALRRVAADGHEVCGVVLRAVPGNALVAEAASELGFPVFQPERVNAQDFVEVARRLAPELILSVNYNQILGTALLALPPRGAVNVHNGMLPDYGGGGGLYGAVINGESSFGQTAHLMDETIDSGDILMQRTFPILPDDTMAELLARAAAGVADTVSQALQGIASGRAVARPQGADGSYFPRKPDGDEIIDWSESSVLLLNKIRARRPGPGNVTYVGDRRLVVWRAAATRVPTYVGPAGQVIARRPEGVVVKTGDSAILLREVQFDGELPRVPRLPVGTCFLANWRKAYLDLRADVLALERRVRQLEALLNTVRAGTAS